MGRSEALSTLHNKLQERKRVAICAISGMGGMGKTELALQYSLHYQQQNTYSGGMCWLQAGEADVGTQIVNFARTQLDLQPPDDLGLITQVSYCWRHWREGEVLVVLDDVRDYQDVKSYLPRAESRFKVLITTRRKWLGESFEQLDLKVLSENASLELLASFAGEERIQQELNEAKELCEDLGYLPLGLELVGRYLKRREELSMAKMRQRLELEHRSLQQPSGDMTAERGVAAAFEMSWKELDKQAQELGCLLSIFALAPIPWKLVEQCLPEQDQEDLEDLRDDALLSLSLLERRGQGRYQLHQLIREFFSRRLEQLVEAEKFKEIFCQVMVAEALQIPETPTQRDIAEATPIIPHLAEVATNQKNWLNDEDLIKPFVGLGYFYRGQGAYSQQEAWHQQCLEMTKNRFGNEHPSIATSLSRLASAYRVQGKYSEAKPLQEKALTMKRKLLGEEHIDVADSLNNLGLLFKAQGKYVEAEPPYIQSLAMRRKFLGEEHVDVADSLNNLALLYDAQGRYEEAESLFLQALEMRQKLLGEMHPRVATSFNNLASCYYSQQRYNESEKLYLNALELYKKLHGLEHRDVAAALNNLAQIYASQKRYEEAEPMLLDALKIQKKILGEDHPHVATGFNNLASIYHDVGKLTEAESFYKQAVEMRKRILGENHHYVAILLNNLAKLYNSQKRYSEAENLYLNAIEILEFRLNPQHPHLIQVKRNLQEIRIAVNANSGNT
ncbi:MAG: tetratricopeptide repeat protein [Symploca sp. SIO2D2]|nr:tetratricopeptide repeat protein [Symploca sp. SIO2D2]